MKQQKAPNKDMQKEIADMTEVNGISVQRVPSRTTLCGGINMSVVLSIVNRHCCDLPVAEG